MVTFSVGELFGSFGDVQQKLNDYSEHNYCHFYIKDSKKLSPDEIINPHLIYKHIVYSCIYGGQKPRFRGSGCRSVTSIRHGCGASLYLRVTKDRTHLQVRNFTETHNHDISEEMFRSAAQDKKLPDDLRTEVEELLLLGADKDRLIEYIRLVTHKNLDKKNLFNIYDTAIKQQREISRDRAVMLVQKAYGLDTEQEGEQVLQQLLMNSRPRRHRKQDVELMEDVQVAYYNDGDETQGEILEEVDESLHRLMGTLSGHDGERIVIVQQDDEDPIQVIQADGGSMEVSEYLDDEEKDTVVVKQEANDESTHRYLTINDISRGMNQRKRPALKSVTAKGKPLQDERPTKTRILSNSNAAVYDDSSEITVDQDGLYEARIENFRVEHEKLSAETEMLVIKKNKIVKDMSQLEVEKSKLNLEIEMLKEKKKYIELKSNWLQDEAQTRELKNEKLKLEIEKLKLQMTSAGTTTTSDS